MNKALSFFAVIGILLASTGYAAEKQQICNLQITGEIDYNTPKTLISRYNALNNGKPAQCRNILLMLDSNGGNVEAAIQAGEFARQKKMWTGVAVNSSCASACVFILLGGVTRTPLGNIGLHRPFTDELSTSESAAKNKYEKTNLLIRQYLSRMDIPETLLTVMNSVPPGQVKWLNGSSDSARLQELGIYGEDAVFVDQRDSASAKGRGISKKEYYSREQKIKTICGDVPVPSNADAFQRYIKCYEDVINGRL